jgi:hypothetical protein
MLLLLLLLLLLLCRRKYADMSSKPKYRFQHLQMDPYVSLKRITQCSPHAPGGSGKGGGARSHTGCVCVGTHVGTGDCCRHP